MKILVIERDLLLRRLYQEELSEWGYEPIVLSRGDQLLKSIAGNKPQVVILGVKISGYENEPLKLLEQIKDSFPDLPVIFNTSLGELWPQARAKGADFYSHKTSDLTELKEMIETAITTRKTKVT
jgi:DNA-binding NtrC family response regulator